MDFPNDIRSRTSRSQFRLFYLIGIVFLIIRRLLAVVKKEPLREVEELYWVNSLPAHLRPTPDKIKRLEHLRYLWGIPKDIFGFNVVAGTRWATEQVQRHLFERGKVEAPSASDKEIFKEIIMARTSARIPYGWDMSEEDVDKIVESITSVDDLVDFVLFEERRELSWPDPFRIGNRIEKILSS